MFLITKQVVFDEALNIQVFLLKNVINLEDIFGIGKVPSVTDTSKIEQVIQEVHKIKLCIGGPRHSEFKNISPETAFVDA